MKEIIALQPDNKEIGKRKRVAAYARVSVDSDVTLHSVDAQISYYSRMIQKNPEWEYAGVYADRGISGTRIKKRDAFQELMDECRKGNVDIILCKSISRFARNTVDMLESIRHLKKLSVEVRFEREHLSSLSKDGEFMLTILASFAQEEVRSTSENYKWAIRKRFAEGTAPITLKRVLGYHFDDELKKYIVIPEEAEIVREMFQMYLDGMSCRRIAKILNERGIRSVNGNQFYYSSIYSMLHNPAYAGDILHQRCYIEDPITKKQKKNHGELPQYLMQDCHEAIIDRETYEKVLEEQKLRKFMYEERILGYEYDRKLNRYVIIPEEAEIVKLIFKMYADGVTQEKIAEEMNELGVKTLNGNNYNGSFIRKLIRKEVYGVGSEGQDVLKATGYHKNIPLRQIAKSEPIIDTETYARVKQELDRRIRARNKSVFGYRLIIETGKFEIVPEEAESVRLMFDMYINGYYFSAIAEELAVRHVKNLGGSYFEYHSLQRLIRNDFYFVDRSNDHEPIIDAKTYEKYKEERERREGLLKKWRKQK